MDNKDIPYKINAVVWKHEGIGGWHFVSIPKDTATTIRTLYQMKEEGWGRLKAEVSIGMTNWKTSIWYDTKRETYLLPIKTSIRKLEKLDEGQNVEVLIWI